MGAISVPARSGPSAIVFARAEDMDAARQQSLRECHLRNRLRRLVCSMAWEEALYSLWNDSKLRPRNDVTTALHNHAIYPPGGHRTLMVRCDFCRRHIPPQAVARPLLCRRCLADWELDPGSIPRAAPLWGKCTNCRAPDELAEVRICDECDANNMSPLQVARAVSAHRSDRVVPAAELAAHFEGEGYRRSRRVRFRCDDPRVEGGWVDYSRLEDGEIRPWFGLSEQTPGDGADEEKTAPDVGAEDFSLPAAGAELAPTEGTEIKHVCV